MDPLMFLFPRVWSAALVVVGGHLAGRMERGVMNVVLSTAACSMILPPLLKLAMTGERRSALQLAVTSVLAILAGQGFTHLSSMGLEKSDNACGLS